jgi:hypothetical protein
VAAYALVDALAVTLSAFGSWRVTAGCRHRFKRAGTSLSDLNAGNAARR